MLCVSFAEKNETHMQMVNGRISYQMDNLFYERFGMSCDELFEALVQNEKLSDLYEPTKVTAFELDIRPLTRASSTRRSVRPVMR